VVRITKHFWCQDHLGYSHQVFPAPCELQGVLVDPVTLGLEQAGAAPKIYKQTPVYTLRRGVFDLGNGLAE